MLDDAFAGLGDESKTYTPVILRQKAVKSCHINLPDTPKPISAIFYSGKFYSYVKCFPSLELAKKGAMRLMERGNAVVLTQAPKGLVLWVMEQDAQLATKPVVH